MDLFETKSGELTWIQDELVHSYRLIPSSVRANPDLGTLVFRMANVEDSDDSHEVIISRRGDDYFLRADNCPPDEEYQLEAFLANNGALFHTEDDEAKCFYKLSWDDSDFLR